MTTGGVGFVLRLNGIPLFGSHVGNGGAVGVDVQLSGAYILNTGPCVNVLQMLNNDNANTTTASNGTLGASLTICRLVNVSAYEDIIAKRKLNSLFSVFIYPMNDTLESAVI